MDNFLDKLKTNLDSDHSLDALMIDIDLIDTKEQVRKTFTGIESFAESILDVGKIYSPLVVIKNGRRFTLHQGERRLRAARYLVSQGHEKFKKVPVTFAEFKSEAESFRAQLAENSARADLHILDWASAVEAYRDNHDSKTGWKGRLAKSVDKDPSFITLCLKIGSLPDEIKSLAKDDILTTPRRLVELSNFVNFADLAALLQKGESYPDVIKKGKTKKAKAKKKRPSTKKSLSVYQISTLADFLTEKGYISAPEYEHVVDFIKKLKDGNAP